MKPKTDKSEIPRIVHLVLAERILEGNTLIVGAFYDELRAREFANEGLGLNMRIQQIRVV